VDETLKTTGNNSFAVGDVTARLPFTHVAAHHARVATINALLGTGRTVDETIPWVTFTGPEATAPRPRSAARLGALFGPLWGTVVTVIGATIGASVAFSSPAPSDATTSSGSPALVSPASIPG